MPRGHKLSDAAATEIGNLIRRNRGPNEGRRSRSGFARREAKIIRTATVYETVTAATSTKPGVGEALLDKIRTDDRTFAEPEATPVTVYNLSSTTFLPGTRLQLSLDQTAFDLSASRRQRAVWVVVDYLGASSTITEIKVGRGTNPVHDFTAAGVKKIGWLNTLTFNNDAAVFEQAHGPGTIWEYIKLKVAGRFRVHYRVAATKQSTGSGDEILTISCYVVRLRGGGDTVVDNSLDTGDMPAIDDIGTPRSSMQATTVADFEANDQLRVDCSFAGSASNLREVTFTEGVFIVTRTQTA